MTRQLVTALETGRKGGTTIGSDAYRRVLGNILLQYSENATFLWHGASFRKKKLHSQLKNDPWSIMVVLTLIPQSGRLLLSPFCLCSGFVRFVGYLADFQEV